MELYILCEKPINKYLNLQTNSLLFNQIYDFSGKKLQSIFSDPFLEELANFLPKDEDSDAIISYMRSILKLHKICLAKELNGETMEHVEHMETFKACFERVRKPVQWRKALDTPQNCKQLYNKFED